MALGDSYSTLAKLRARVGITDDANTSQDSQLTSALATASRGIEQACGRQFNLAATATARIYYPDSDICTRVDDFASTTGLVIAVDSGNDGTYETTWSASDYQLEPLNGVVDGQTGWPYYEIRAVSGVRFPCVSMAERAPLRVTAIWGWSAVPSPVEEGCLILAEEIYSLKHTPFGVGGYGAYGIIRARQNPMVWTRIAPYVVDPVKVG